MAEGHGFKGISLLRGKWRSMWRVSKGGGQYLSNGYHLTAEEAAHHTDILLYLIYGEDAEHNLPERMTPALKAQLDGYEDVHAYLKERKEAAEKKRDERYRKGSSAYRGVSWFKQDGKWRVRIWMPHLGGRPKRVLLGYFADEGEAARTYDRAVIPLHGRAAMLNFPLASYIAAGEFTEAQLDAIDARLAAGKPAPAFALVKSKAKPKQAPPRRRTAAAGAGDAAHSAEGRPSGSNSGNAAAAVEDGEDDDVDAGSEFWSSEGEEELLLGAAAFPHLPGAEGFVRIGGRRIAIPGFHTPSGCDLFADPDADVTLEELA